MPRFLPITSLKNPRVRAVLALDKAKERNVRGVFAVEGAREIDRALRSGYEAVETFFCRDALSAPARALLVAREAADDGAVYDVTPEIFARLAVREGSDGLVVVFRQRRRGLADLRLPASPLLLAVEGVEKPGNLGALLRSADGASVDAVVVLDHSVDVHNPHVVRASLGTVFHVPVALATATEFREFCRTQALRVYAAALSTRSQPYTAVDLRGPSVLLLGSEKDGLSPFWLEAADHLVQIPMGGIADSLNVATAGAVLMYEARRQRGVGSVET